jgi:hypothetical protein
MKSFETPTVQGRHVEMKHKETGRRQTKNKCREQELQECSSEKNDKNKTKIGTVFHRF